MPSPKEEASKTSSRQPRSRKTDTDHGKAVSDTVQASKTSSRQPRSRKTDTDHGKAVSDTVQASKTSSRQPRSRKTATDHGKAVSDTVQAFWSSKDSEVVVAVIQSVDKSVTYTLRLTEFKSLKPHNWLNGEIIESYIQTLLNSKGFGRKIFLFNHYSAGVVVFGERSAMSNHSFRTVSFENYDAIIGFVQVHKNHWKFLYLHRTLQKVFVVDPQGIDEGKDSELAAARFRTYFKMREELHGKTEWVDVTWTHGVFETQHSGRCLQLWSLCHADG
ncbi:uncharacterized protein [Pseudorasbora parva]|uniref:uncharacterized protein n=1 Tax=Pseudorasbora parva TaxID=51549 RepID=UPI00351F329B